MFTYRFAVNDTEADGLVHLPSVIAHRVARAPRSLYIRAPKGLRGRGRSSPLALRSVAGRCAKARCRSAVSLGSGPRARVAPGLRTLEYDFAL